MRLIWNHNRIAGNNTDPAHICENNTPDEKSRRVSALSDAERAAYKWLFEGYSEAWTTETFGLEKRDAKKLYASIYKKLGIETSREIVLYYAPKDVRLNSQPGAEASGVQSMAGIVLPNHNSGCFTGTTETIKKKKVYRNKRMKTFAAACLAVMVIGVWIITVVNNQQHGIVLEDEQVPLGAIPFMEPDINAKPYSGEAVNTTGEPGNLILDYDGVTIPADTPDVQMLLLNTEDNAYNFTFEIVLADTGELLYVSGLVEPGWCIEDITLVRGLSKGEYKAKMKILAFEPGGYTSISSTTIDFTLTVRAC